MTCAESLLPAPGTGAGVKWGVQGRVRFCALVLLAALLGGCAGLRGTGTPLPLEAQQQLLRDLPGFSLRGRAKIIVTDAITGEKKGPPSPYLTWKQDGEQASFRLSGQFGVGQLTVRWQPGELHLDTGDEVYVGADAEQVLINEIGFVPPFEALRYWILGLDAPGEAPTERRLTDDGRIASLAQQQWQLRYRSWRTARARGGTVELPRRLDVTRDNLSLTVLVDRWSL